MDSLVNEIEAAALKNIARIRALLQSSIDDADRHGLLRLLTEEQRKLLLLRYGPAK